MCHSNFINEFGQTPTDHRADSPGKRDDKRGPIWPNWPENENDERAALLGAVSETNLAESPAIEIDRLGTYFEREGARCALTLHDGCWRCNYCFGA